MDILIDNGLVAPARTGLVVMLKAPANAKRRLAAQVGDLAEEAAARLLACALEDALAWPGPTWLSPADPQDRDWLLSEIGAETTPEPTLSPQLGTCGDPHDSTVTHHDEICGLILQQGANLGERINYVDGELRHLGELINYVDNEMRRRGIGGLIFVGTDCPGLDSAYLSQAASNLQSADAVLGPAEDGGVVLMGARRPWPDLRELGWGTQNLCAELHSLCRTTGWSVAMLDARKDIDTLRDLLGAGAALSDDRRASRRGFAEWLRAHRGALLARRSDGAAEMLREAVS